MSDLTDKAQQHIWKFGEKEYSLIIEKTDGSKSGCMGCAFENKLRECPLHDGAIICILITDLLFPGSSSKFIERLNPGPQSEDITKKVWEFEDHPGKQFILVDDFPAFDIDHQCEACFFYRSTVEICPKVRKDNVEIFICVLENLKIDHECNLVFKVKPKDNATTGN